MIISHEHEFIFIHIQRTAGTSIEKSICNALGINQWEGFIGEPRQVAIDKKSEYEDVYFNSRRREFEGKKHITATEMKKFVGDEVWSSYFTFSFVRNPWSRVLSSYLKRRKEFSKHLRLFWPRNKFIFNVAVLYKLGIIGPASKSQFDYISNGNDEIIVDFIGKFERLNEDFGAVCSRTGVDAELTNNNDTTYSRSYKQLYYSITKKIVENHEAEIVDRFDYTF